MSFLGKLFGGGVREVVDGVADVVDRFHVSDDEKHEMLLQTEKVVTDRLRALQEGVQARFEMVSSIIQSEMAQGDNYTKRARPTLVYFGMGMIFVNYLLVPILQTFAGAEKIEPFELPTEFWAAWGGTVAIWSVGRSAEKRGAANKLTSKITGNPNVVKLFEKLDEAA